MLEIRNLCIRYNRLEIVKKSNFVAFPGQLTCIHGESGTGKTSLLYLIAMLSNQTCEYYYNHSLLQLNDKQKEMFRYEHVAFITQNSTLIETINVSKNIELALMQSSAKYSLDELLEMVHLEDKKDAMPRVLSGGERQRLAIACAIARDSDILLGDEVTSALDDENKKIIMSLFKKCCDDGKTVILVSHEDDVVYQCDRIYKLEYLQLSLEKDSQLTEIMHHTNCIRQVKLSQLFDLVFLSTRRNNIFRIFISVLVMLCLFAGTSMYVFKEDTVTSRDFYTETVTENEIVLLNDVSKMYEDDKTYLWLVRSSGDELGFSEEQSKQLGEVEHIDAIYDYYKLSNDMISTTGRWSLMELEASRNNAPIQKRELSEEEEAQGYSLDYVVKPFYSEQKCFKEGVDGIYINENMAHMYNLQVGDKVLMDMNIPFACLQTLNETPNALTQVLSKSQYYVCEKVEAEYTVLDVVNLNENYAYENAVYLYHKTMETLIDEQIERYENQEITINRDAYEGYSTVCPLTTPEKRAFVDHKDNIPPLTKALESLIPSIAVGYDYVDVQRINDELESSKRSSNVLLYMVLALFAFGAFVVEMLYLNKMDSMMKYFALSGFMEKIKKQIVLSHALLQLMIYTAGGIVLYFISVLLNLFNLHEMSDVFYFIYVYTQFSLRHFVIFFVAGFIVFASAHCVRWMIWNKNEITGWIRKN